MFRPIALLVVCLILPTPVLGESPPAPPPPSEMAGVPAPAAQDTRWAPLDVGNRWSYVFARERSRSTNRGEPVVERFRGARTAQVRPADAAWGPRTVELRSVIQGRTEGKPTDSVEKQRDFVTFDGRSLHLLAREAVHPMRETAELVKFAPPLEVIRGATTEGHTWNVGTEQAGGVQTPTQGEVLGIQDARTPAGLFENCLVVKRTGNLRGRLEVYGSEIEVRSGTVTTTEWYAPGVGLVLAKSDSEQTMVLEDGSLIEFVEKTQLALREVKLARAASAPSPVPAAPAPPSTEPELNPQMPIPSHADEAGAPGSAMRPATESLPATAPGSETPATNEPVDATAPAAKIPADTRTGSGETRQGSQDTQGPSKTALEPALDNASQAQPSESLAEQAPTEAALPATQPARGSAATSGAPAGSSPVPAGEAPAP